MDMACATSVLKLGDGTIRREEARREVLWRATHDGHLGSDIHLIDVVRPVGLAEHAIDNVAEGMKFEAKVKVHETVLRGLAVAVDLRVLIRDRHGAGRDAEHIGEIHLDGVDDVCAFHG